jgi:hypothetical protein
MAHSAAAAAAPFDLAQPRGAGARHHEHMKKPLPQVGAPDPELNTSPIVDESQLDEKAGARDLELEEAVCHFNNEEFPIGTYVQSGDEVLKCTGRGVWERRGEKRP